MDGQLGASPSPMVPGLRTAPASVVRFFFPGCGGRRHRAPPGAVRARRLEERRCHSRRRAPGADPEVRSFGEARVCTADGCETQLSRYNPDIFCSVHRGWDRQVVTRRRRTGSNGAEQNGTQA